MTAGSVRLEMAQVTRNTVRKLDPVRVSRAPATALPKAFASDFAVKYQAKAEPMAFSSPFSAMRALTAGSRTEVERPCTLRIV